MPVPDKDLPSSLVAPDEAERRKKKPVKGRARRKAAPEDGDEGRVGSYMNGRGRPRGTTKEDSLGHALKGAESPMPQLTPYEWAMAKLRGNSYLEQLKSLYRQEVGLEHPPAEPKEGPRLNERTLRQLIVVDAIERGHFPRDAAALAEMPYEELEAMIETDTKFRQALEAAVARHKDAQLQVLEKAGKKNWFAASWSLERRYPENWSKYRKIEEPEEEEAPVIQRTIQWKSQKSLPPAPKANVVDTTATVVNEPGADEPPEPREAKGTIN